jgi:predicted MPP superfamily phosphohydrolase
MSQAKALFPRFLAAFVLIAAVVVATAARPESGAPSLNFQPAQYPFKFVAYGDLRTTDPSNTKDTDPVRRMALISKIADEGPAFVGITGDLVLDGDNNNDWAEWDRETKPFSGLQLFPILGNHDVRKNVDQALGNFFRRFPQLENSRYYAAQYGNVRLFGVDSDLMVDHHSPEMQWLTNEFNNIPVTTDFVLVLLHHPSYTRSNDQTGHAARPQEHHLGSFLEEKQKTMKARIVEVAGHVHNYERYEHGNVTYIVSGGAGASPYPIERGPDDFYKESGPTYHYCRFTSSKGKLHMEMVKLEMNGDKPNWRVADSFDLTK